MRKRKLYKAKKKYENMFQKTNEHELNYENEFWNNKEIFNEI